jgi:hypothetical protein
MSTVITPEPQTAAPVSPATATGSKLFGILSLVSGGVAIFTGHLFLFAAAAIVLGILGLRKEPASRAFSIWGIVLGSVMIVLPILAILGAIVFLAPFALWSAATGH